MIRNKRIGIFMRVFRNEPTVHQAIKSVLGQSYKNFRYYILVNETTRGIIEEYMQNDSRIEILETPDDSLKYGFVTYAKYIAEDGNDYVGTIDADDWYEETYLESLLAFAEENFLDIAAGGNYFFSENEGVVGERKQRCMIWQIEETNKYIFHVYGFFRTIWGKLFASHVIINSDFSCLPEGKQYGGYGGDTMMVMNLLLTAKKIGVSEKVLYYYRMSPTSGTYKLLEGRLDSDRILFEFVIGVLQKIGEVNSNTRHFLLLVYGNALVDTTKLLAYTSLTELERVTKLRYIYENYVSKELFGIADKEIQEIKRKLCTILFMNKSRWIKSEQIGKEYVFLFEMVFPELKGKISIEEFKLLLKSNQLLEAYINKEYHRLFEMLMVILRVLDEEEQEICQILLRRLNGNKCLIPVLRNLDVVKTYKDIIGTIHNGRTEETFKLLLECFSGEELPKYADVLIELWSELAIDIENVKEYIFAKELKIDMLIQRNELEQARQEFSYLEQLEVNDSNMNQLKKLLLERS